MKSESQVRHLRDTLLVLARTPCTCEGTIHEDHCKTGGKMMAAVLANLSWVLGENDGMQDHVDRVAENAAAVKRAV